jgi:hypothetical protein
VQGFKSALERRIAQKLAAWQPEIHAFFKFDESWKECLTSWNGSLHLFVKVHHLSDAMQPVSENLDHSLLRYLKQLDWSRFRARQSILELQQVTPGLPSSTAGWPEMCQRR